MDINKILQKATSIRDMLKKSLDDKDNPIDTDLNPITPYVGKDRIKVVIIGQDPTIRNPKRRANISCTLNLDKQGSLLRYIKEDLCDGLGISIDNVYATNIFKYFYTTPPAGYLSILSKHLRPNLELIKEEINDFPDVPIITLGEPVLALLAHDKVHKKVRFHWDYNTKTKVSNHHLKFCPPGKNKLTRIIFPFPHQPSLRKAFYRTMLSDYIAFMRNQINK